MNEIEKLKKALAALDDVIDLAIAGFKAFPQRLADGIEAARAGDVAALEELKSDMDTHAEALAQVVKAGT